MFNENLSKLVRGYLRNVPVTEGKKQLLSITMPFIIPDEKKQIARMKYDFRMNLNLKNKDHLRIWLYGEHDERYEIRMVGEIIKEGGQARNGVAEHHWNPWEKKVKELIVEYCNANILDY